MDDEKKSPLHQLGQGFQHYGRELSAFWVAEKANARDLFSWDKAQPAYKNVGARLHYATNALTEGLRALPYTLCHLIIAIAIWKVLVAPFLS